MTRHTVAAILFLAIAPTAGLAAGPQDAADLPARIEKAFGSLRVMTARFTQKIENKGFGGVRLASGFMAMKKPDRIRWEYTEPAPILIVADGERLWYYDQPENTVYIESLQGWLGPQSPAMFLAGEAPLSAIFDVSPSSAASEGEAAIKLAPKAPQPGLKAILLKVDAKTYTIVELVMVDHLGNRNTISFTDVDANASPDPSMFRFTPPSGAKISRTAKTPGL
jgi:outer membrane lipoprotein carrier protein